MMKAPEAGSFQMLGTYETLGSKLSHEILKKFADGRLHLRKVSRRTFIPFKIENLLILLTLFVT